jgi:hypothetical protein
MSVFGYTSVKDSNHVMLGCKLADKCDAMKCDGKACPNYQPYVIENAVVEMNVGKKSELGHS